MTKIIHQFCFTSHTRRSPGPAGQWCQCNEQELNPSLGEASSDDQFMLPSAFANLITTDQHFYLWEKTPYYFENDWSESYAAVYTANFCLEGLNKLERTSANAGPWNNVKGSALFYRSYNFLNLLWNYSKAYDKATSTEDWGIVLRTTSDFNDPSVRASVEACYQQVINDKNRHPITSGDSNACLPAVQVRGLWSASEGISFHANIR